LLSADSASNSPANRPALISAHVLVHRFVVEGEPVAVIVARQRALARRRGRSASAWREPPFAACDARGARRRRVAARHHRFGFVIKLAQQLALPAVPHAGPHGADIGDGQHQQQAQHLRRLHGVDEIAHGLGIGDVALLRGVAHHQMVAHQPRHGAVSAGERPSRGHRLSAMTRPPSNDRPARPLAMSCSRIAQ
jgi:hypothetical protein